MPTIENDTSSETPAIGALNAVRPSMSAFIKTIKAMIQIVPNAFIAPTNLANIPESGALPVVGSSWSEVGLESMVLFMIHNVCPDKIRAEPFSIQRYSHGRR